MLKTGSIILSIWSGINFILASLILTTILVFKSDAPILVMVFEKSEIASLDSRVILSLNALAILYNSFAVSLSLMTLFIIWSSLIRGHKLAFWLLLITMGFMEILAFVASAPLNHARWQVNVPLTVLYVLGIVLAGFSIFKRPQFNK